MLDSPVVRYLYTGAVLALQQLLLVLGPTLILALVLNQLSKLVRGRAARLVGVGPYVWLTAIGVVIHELGHLLFCVIFRHKIVRASLFRPEADGTLGYVEHAYDRRSLYQSIGNFFIGTGPIWLGAAVLYGMCAVLLGPAMLEPLRTAVAPVGDPGMWDSLQGSAEQTTAAIGQVMGNLVHAPPVATWRTILFIYLAFCIGSHMTLSISDILGAAKGFFTLVLAVLVLNWMTLWLDPAGWGSAGWQVARYGVAVYVVMLLAITINLVMAALLVAMSGVLRR